MPAKREFRVAVARELRADQEDGKQFISGYAAVFNSLSEEMFGFRERIMPGAFSRTLSEKPDVRQLINHDSNLVLGRTRSGTLQLSEDDNGLYFRCELPATTYANDLIESIRRGDISQCSFGFVTRKQAWIESEDDVVREIHDVDLFDTSVVTYPAYTETSVNARAELRQLFPDGIPADIREHRDEDCLCSCAYCQLDDCENCDNPNCEDPNCEGHDETVGSRKRGERRRTRLVAGKPLAMDKFALVGDPDDISTWALPVDQERHVRESLVAYGVLRSHPLPQQEGADLEKVWNALTTAAKKFGITMSPEQLEARAYTLDAEEGTPPVDQRADLCANVSLCARSMVRVAERPRLQDGPRLAALEQRSGELAGLVGELGNVGKPAPPPPTPVIFENHADISRAARAEIAKRR